MKKLDETAVTSWVVSYLADFLDVDAKTITADVNFDELGLDSVDSVIVGGALEEAFDVEIDATLFLRNSNLTELVSDLRVHGIVA